jgi:DNA (cytosine-5)-methyltransferase 1
VTVAIDLFAGPGGWDLAAHALGIRPLGVELDADACATREAAGLDTLTGDVAALDPATVARDHVNALRRADADAHGAEAPVDLTAAEVDLLIASPPCQAFSMAGAGAGRRAMAAYRDAIDRWAEGDPPTRADLDAQCDDERAHLVLEPLRWALALRPRRIALEQVEPVLPIWEWTAAALRRHGYQAWAGGLTAERYGVPQTRRRAILTASLDGPVAEPPPTHQRYVAPRRRAEATLSMFDAPEPERIIVPGEEHLAPWVSMADALGWGTNARPYFPLACSSTTGGPDMEKVGGSGARELLYREQAEGRWAMRSNDRPRAAVRAVDEPAATITGGHDYYDRQWTNAEDAIRVELDEVTILQTFPAGYPWQGTKSARFRQVGNAIPPLLALAVLANLLGQPITVEPGSGTHADGWLVDTGNTRGGTRTEGRWRKADEPSPTVTSRADQLEWRAGGPDDAAVVPPGETRPLKVIRTTGTVD